jgi:hypothetical protein
MYTTTYCPDSKNTEFHNSYIQTGIGNGYHSKILRANFRPSKHENSNCKPFSFHPEFGIPSQFNSRDHFCASKQSIRESAIFQKEFRSSATAADEFRGTEVSVTAPCRDGEVPPEPSPSVFIAVSAISIDLSAISINLAVSYDEEGVVLPRG